MARNLKRKGKTLRAVKSGGEPVRLHVAGDEYQEASWVVEQVASRRGARAAILYRMNAQSRLLEEALLRLRIPYVVVGGLEFLRPQGGQGPACVSPSRPEPPGLRSPCAVS